MGPIRRLARGVAAACALVGLATPPAAAVSFDTVVSLGDSLTKAQTNAFPWVARQLGVPLHNVAVNGATTTSLVADQLDLAVALDPTFAFIWIGGNDIKNDPIDFAKGLFDPWIANFETALDALLATGADVITANLFDVGLAPWIYQYVPNPTPEFLAGLDERTREWNARIEAAAAARGVPVVNVYSLFEAMAAGDVTVAGSPFLLAPSRGTSMHLFADTMHPSLVARAIIANQIIDTMNAEYGLSIARIPESQLAEIAGIPVPEPDGAALLAAGLLLLAAGPARRPRARAGTGAVAC